MAMNPLTPEQKQALAVLRTSLGGIGEEKRKVQKHLIASRKAIQQFLVVQAATVPQIAEALNMPSDEVLWHLTGMRKYGKVAEVGEDGDYLLYAPVAYEEKSAASH